MFECGDASCEYLGLVMQDFFIRTDLKRRYIKNLDWKEFLRKRVEERGSCPKPWAEAQELKEGEIQIQILLSVMKFIGISWSLAIPDNLSQRVLVKWERTDIRRNPVLHRGRKIVK